MVYINEGEGRLCGVKRQRERERSINAAERKSF